MQMEPELLKEIRPETHAGLAAALNDSSDEENTTDDSMEEVQTEELHETQSLCEPKETPAAAPTAARGEMDSITHSLPNFAKETEDKDQNSVTQNALQLALIQRSKSQNISMPNLVRPEVYSSVKMSVSSEQQVLVCLATDFHPKRVQMEIRRDQTPLPEEQLNSSGIRPNADGSFQLMKSLKIL
ncbi:H-2 class I histocompatibility Q10 alpha chain-like protein [Labeo rohita]|uniref:H-2 class I histocompatibility Q10 alpha chain-like protein n=1 Tax=Labeo rohita TaxID=84645 RepID=A0A498NTW0_LABRO|nr:H-2 class I histocompatibility Q10 alpha chain-like protein [Labeo rohita]